MYALHVVRLTALLLVLGACSAEPRELGLEPVTDPVSAMTFNLANRLGEPPAGDAIAAHIADAGADFVAVQEANDGQWLVDRLPARYALTDLPEAGVGLIYDATRWELREHGRIALGDNDDGWGPRYAAWGLFAEGGERGIAVYSTHWCVTIRRPDDACDFARQLDYADHILDVIDPGLPAVVAGDFNVFDDFEDGPVVSYMTEAGLIDAYRAMNPTGDATTFIGNDWAPSGRIDYLFATEPVEVLAAEIRSTAGEDASDHYAVTATLAF